ncbi:MAG: antitoxin VapB family protein [Promethearchaeota archaeon]
MAQKTISLPESVYKSLKKKKRKKETFADVILRLLHPDSEKSSKEIEKYFGKLDEADGDEWDKIERDIYLNRKKSPKREILSYDD